MMDVKIIVAVHKDYRMPDDPVYLPMQVGAAGKATLHEDWLRDDTGEHISRRNKTFCELTGLYWAWKNLDADAIGLVHYRRHFGAGRAMDRWARIAGGAEIASMLEQADVLLPRKREYFIETNYSQYVHAHHAIDLIETKRILAERCPAYLPAWEQVMARTGGHRFNMLVMKKDVLCAYCAWLFDILFELERRLDISAYNALDSRVFGLVSERLLDVWLVKNDVAFKELPVVHMERQHWGRKAARFLGRKLAGGK